MFTKNYNFRIIILYCNWLYFIVKIDFHEGCLNKFYQDHKELFIHFSEKLASW